MTSSQSDRGITNERQFGQMIEWFGRGIKSGWKFGTPSSLLGEQTIDTDANALIIHEAETGIKGLCGAPWSQIFACVHERNGVRWLLGYRGDGLRAMVEESFDAENDQRHPNDSKTDELNGCKGFAVNENAQQKLQRRRNVLQNADEG